MKKLIAILLLFAGFVAKSQVVIPRSPKQIISQDARLYATFNLKIPIYADTTSANAMIGKDSLGLLIQIRTTGIVYTRDTSAGTHKWTPFATNTGNGTWGLITGTIGSQTDLQTALSAKQNILTPGTSAQYYRGDLSLATFPTVVSSFTNDAGYLTSNAVNSLNSITGDGTSGNKLQLSGDALTPGASKYYGTNGGGTKGFYALPVTGTGTVTQIVAAAPLTGGTITTTGTIGIDTSAFGIATKTDIAKYLPITRIHGSAPRILYYDANGVISYTNFKYDSGNTRLDFNAWSLYSNDGTNSFALFPGNLTFLKTGCSNCNIQLNSGVGAHINIGVLATDIGGDINSFATGVGAPGAAGMAKIYIGKNTSTSPGTGSLKLGDGLLVATPESGLVEYRNGWFMITDSDIVAHTNSRDTIATRSFARQFGGGSVGVSSIPPNLGSGYRVYAPQTPGFKTFTVSNGIKMDSTTTTLAMQVDSAKYVTQYQFNNSTAIISLRTPGTGAGQFHLAYVNANTLVIPDWADGYGFKHSIAMDSLVTAYIDTTSSNGLVSKQRLANTVFAAGGGSPPGGADNDFQTKRGTLFAGGGMTWDPTNKMANINFSQNNEEGFIAANPNTGANGAAIVGATNGSQTTKVVQHGSGNAYAIIPDSAGAIYSNAAVLSIYNDNANTGGGVWIGSGANISAAQIRITPTKIKFNSAVFQTGSASDSFLVKNTADSAMYAVALKDVAVNVDAAQTYTSGATLTVTSGNNYVYINPASVQATLTLTLPTTWHNSGELFIVFGGTITSGNPVITNLTIVAGSGQTLVQANNPNGLTYYAGEVLQYKLNGTLDYRIQ